MISFSLVTLSAAAGRHLVVPADANPSDGGALPAEDLEEAFPVPRTWRERERERDLYFIYLQVCFQRYCTRSPFSCCRFDSLYEVRIVRSSVRPSVFCLIPECVDFVASSDIYF